MIWLVGIVCLIVGFVIGHRLGFKDGRDFQYSKYNLYRDNSCTRDPTEGGRAGSS